MLFDVIIRLLAAFGQILIITQTGITTPAVVMSVCVFFILECSLLFNKKVIYGCLTALPFFMTSGYLIACNPSSLGIYLTAVIIIAGFTAISLLLYAKMTEYKSTLYRTRDDSKELEAMLKNKNRRLLLEQDQQVHVATLAERNRIAREIHDNVGHLISRAILLLGAISTVNKDENIAPQLKMLSDTLDESMAKMRQSVHDLHDDSIDLGKNFDEIIAELKEYTVNTELDIEESIPTNIKLTLIGILKEAVTNILRHSNGDTVSVILHMNYSFCTLSVSDNGTLTKEEKAALSAENYDGIGLINIKNRATSVGGDAYFYTDSGFTVFARLPLEK